MEQIKIVYWSQTGNTQAMAEELQAAIEKRGGNAQVIEVSGITVHEIKDDGKIAFGCPAMGAEVLEETEMEPFIEEYEAYATGKKLALFGSYGWGNGEWMHDWEARMTKAGATILGGEGVIAMEAPDEDASIALDNLAKLLIQE